MDKATNILYLILGGAGGVALFYVLSRFGFRMPTNPFQQKKPALPEEKQIEVKVDRDTDLGTKPAEMHEETDSGTIMDKQAEKIRQRLGLVLVAFILFGIHSDIKAVQPDPVLDNYLLESGNYVKMTGKEFQNLRKEDRKDTKVVTLEKTSNSKTVEIQIPVREPIIKNTKEGLIKAEYKDADPITRKVKVICNDSGPNVNQQGTRFWFYPIVGVMASISSSQTLDVQPSILLEFFHWTNDYMKISATTFAGTKRYGLGFSVGPALYLSNIRLVVAYSREYGSTSKEQFIEVGISTLLYIN
jgi:hypothetical protein